MSRQLRQTRERLFSIHQQVEQTEAFLEQSGGLDSWMVEQQKISQQLMDRLPVSQHMPQLLDVIVNQVAQSNLNLIDVTQGNLEPMNDFQGQPIMCRDTPCLSLGLTLNLEGRFHEVVDYLDVLTSREFPCVVRVNQIQLAVKQANHPLLKAKLDVVMYVRSAS